MSHSFVKSRSNGARKPENTSWWSLQPAISKRCLCFVNVICWKAVYPQELFPHFFSLLNFSEDPNLSVQAGAWTGLRRELQRLHWSNHKRLFQERVWANRKEQPKTVGREDYFESFSGFWSPARFACLAPLSRRYRCGRHQHTAIQSTDEGAFLKITFSP